MGGRGPADWNNNPHCISQCVQGNSVRFAARRVRELRYQLNKLQVKEDEVEVEVKRQRRQVDLFSKPEVLDYAYNAQLPDSDSNLSVYDKWFSDKNDHLKHGLSKHHKVSASWSETGNDYDDNDNVGEGRVHIVQLFSKMIV